MAQSIKDANPLDVLKAGQSAYEASQDPFVLLVLLGHGAPRELVCAVRDALHADCIGGEVTVLKLADYGACHKKPDACIILCGDDAVLNGDAADWFHRQRVPVAFVADTSLVIPHVDTKPGVRAERICSSDCEAVLRRLAHWLVYATKKHMAIAANFAFCRDEEAFRLTNECAAQCAAIGALGFLPGADLPVMCANQSKLALQLASIYGHEVNLSRAVDLLGVVGAGYLWRETARQLLTFVPGVGWAVKAAVGYAGTFATSRALRARLDPQGPSPKLLERAGDGVRSIKRFISNRKSHDYETGLGLSRSMGGETA